MVSSSDDIKIRDGVTKNDDDDAFWRPKDERFPERNATRRRKSSQREKKIKENKNLRNQLLDIKIRLNAFMGIINSYID